MRWGGRRGRRENEGGGGRMENEVRVGKDEVRVGRDEGEEGEWRMR
jgi:hypothetical protein